MDLLEQFLEQYDRTSTRRAYRSDLLHFFDGAPQSFESVQALLAKDPVERFRLKLQPFAASTRQRKRAVLLVFLRWLSEVHGYPTEELVHSIRRWPIPCEQSSPRVRVLGCKEIDELLSAAKLGGEAALRDRSMILSMLHCVLRRSEAAAMDVEHIRRVKRHWVLDLPNTKGGANRYVKMPAHVVESIDQMKEHYGIAGGALWRSLSNNSRGMRLSERSIYGIVARAAGRAGLPEEIGADVLRHTGCVIAFRAGASLQQVQSAVRHMGVESRFRYVHQRDRLRDSAADYIRLKQD